MLIVVLSLGLTDLLFALDSIPAIYGLTSEPYLVFTANVFALMGLRQLYFLIGGLLQRLVYLSYGLAVLLAFIGVKLVLQALHVNELPFINGGEHVEWAPGDPDLALPGRHRGHPRRHHGGQPGQGPRPSNAQGRQRQPRRTGAGRNSRRRPPGLSTGEQPTPDPLRPRPRPGPQRPDHGDALAASVALARTADELGYRRYWVAEHHNMPAVAATNPPVLIAMLAGATARIRVGSGRRDAAQPRAAGGRRAVRAARGGLPGPDRPRHRPGARHRPGDQLRAAPRRRRSRATRPSPASRSTSTTSSR